MAEVGEAGLGGEHFRLTCRSENVSATPRGNWLQIKEHLWRSPTLGRNGQVLYSHSAWSLLGACPGKAEADFAAQMPRGCQLTAPCNPTGSYISKEVREGHPRPTTLTEVRQFDNVKLGGFLGDSHKRSHPCHFCCSLVLALLVLSTGRLI